MSISPVRSQPPGSPTTQSPRQADGLVDGNALSTLLAGEGLEQTVDRLAADLRAHCGPRAKVVIALFEAPGDKSGVTSADGRGEEQAYLTGVDFSEAALEDGIFRVALVTEGLQPLTNGETGANAFRARAAGFHEALRLRLTQDNREEPIGAITVFLANPAADFETVAAAMKRTAELVGLSLRFHTTMKRANDGDSRFAAVAATIPGVIYQRVVYPDGAIRYTYISENAFDLFGVTAEKILTDPEALFAHYAADYRKSFRQRLLQASKDLTLWDVEATIKRPDGQTRYTHAIARPHREEDGSVVWTGVILDATRIKEAELAAAAAEARTREAIVESLSQGILLFDRNDRLTLRNSHFLKLYPNLESSATVGVHYADLIRMELDPERNPEIASVCAETELVDRLHKHGAPHLFYEREMAGDRHILVNEYRTGDDETVVLYTDISELKRRERKIEHLAHHDALTGLPNRVLFHERLTQALRRGAETGTRVAVVCLDLDRFKMVNDTLGHLVGDLLLTEVAQRILSVLRAEDTACRLGGDEFAIIMPMVKDPGSVTSLAWRLLDAIARPITIQEQTVMSGTSIGISISGQDGDAPETLLKNADLALYRAKADGRGTFRFFEQEMDLKAQARRMMELALRTAILREELEVHYQPLVDAHTSEIIGAEALLRWNVPGQGYISPTEFVPLAEETGLINEIGRWVLRKACHDAAGWAGEARVAVNLSPAQMRNSQFVDVVRSILAETGLPARRLELEITESMLLRNTEANTKILLGLKELGVRISMDDFGTGYSSLGNLRSFPFDKIKIDKSFIADLSKRPDAAAIIRAVLTLGRSLGMTTTAEGVETRDQLAYLRAEGCMEVQGFYFASAVENETFAALLSSGNSMKAAVR